MKPGFKCDMSARLCQLRARYGWTQKALAKKAGLDYKFYQSIEAGRRKDVRVSTIAKIAKAYDVELWMMFL